LLFSFFRAHKSQQRGVVSFIQHCQALSLVLWLKAQKIAPTAFFGALPVAIQPGSIRAWFPATGIRFLDRRFRNHWHITWLAI
jgi:hypothetical protein